MKRLLSLFLFTVFTVLFFNGWSFGGSDKKKVEDVSKVTQSNTIAIGKFQLSGRVSSSQYADLLADFRTYIDDEFTKNSKFKVIDNSKIDKILNKRIYDEILSDKEKQKQTYISKLQKNNLVEKDGFVSKISNLFSNGDIKKHKKTNAQYILLGEIKNFNIDKLRGSKINNGISATLSKKHLVVNSYISIALVHVETQEIVAKQNIKVQKLFDDDADANTQISNAMSVLSQEIVSKLLFSMSDTISVINIQDNTVVINGGIQNGIKKDMSFDIYSVSKIVDQTTNKVYTTQSIVATIKINKVDQDISFGTLTNIIKMPKSGNIVKASATIKKKEFNKEKIRIVILDTVIKQGNIKSINSLKKNIDDNLEYLFNQNSAITVTNNNSTQTNAVLGQQLLDELSKGREAGLPLGSLRGADYLVFASIDYLQFNDRKVTTQYIKSLGINSKKVRNAKVKLSGYVHLINVNTANKEISVAVNISKKFKRAISLNETLSAISKEFSQKATQMIFNKISPTRIQEIGFESVILNNGKNIGLKLGDILKVYSEGKTYIDKYTGQEATSYGMAVAKIKVVDFNIGNQAVCEILGGQIAKKGLQVKLVEQNTKSRKNQSYNNMNQSNNNIQQSSMNQKKYMALKPMIFSSSISKYKKKLIRRIDTATSMTEYALRTKNYRILSRATDMMKQQIEERQLNESSLTGEQEEDSDLFSKASYILIPKVTEFKLSTTSKKIEDIDGYDNKDYVYVKISITLMSMNGEVLGISSATKKYSYSWGSDNKLKRKIPTSSKIKNVVNGALDKCLKKLINQLN